MILPKQQAITNLIVDYEHKKNLHGGVQMVHAAIKQRYWIIGGKRVVEKYSKRCVKCRRQRALKLQQMMGAFPGDRVNVARRAFLKTGVDYTGPVQLKVGKGRSNRIEKAWIALFVCMATKAVHIEIVCGLSTEDFIACLYRFIYRCGRPSDLYSDHGTNFVGANSELKKLFELLNNVKHNEKITKTLVEEGITWHFLSQKASHFGGLWEAAIKITKYHLNRIVGNVRLTYEEMSTVLCQIEAFFKF